ncbi:AAA family ATPase [Vibrio parahaemolyticus]|nr:AAA family ATPase [Vibrio parahaemolyticus]
MAIESIRITNLLSFDDVKIENIKDINCIVGKNNVGKSNVLKVLRYFYSKLNNERVLPPELYSKYSSHGSITIRYNTTRIRKIVTGKNNNSPFLKHIYNVIFKGQKKSLFSALPTTEQTNHIDLKLTIFSDDSIKWSLDDDKARNILSILYPFIDIETRHIDLYDWNRVWSLISQLSSFNVRKVDNDEVIDYIDEKVSAGDGKYKDYIQKVEDIIDTKHYSYRDRVLNYIKIGLKGHDFVNSGEELSIQSDGTNSYRFIEIVLKLLIVLTRREYITPLIYIDEPEIGLHPKLNENLILTVYNIYTQFLKTSDGLEKGKYKTPYPKIIFSTHSPNILKFVVRLFRENQQIVHFSKSNRQATKISVLNSQYKDPRFLNVFSDNEARLFFSNFILFVEGATELEIFRNFKLSQKFRFLNDIDVYETNAMVLKYINPSYSKAAIPFLSVNDSDVLVKFDYTNELLTLDKSKFNFIDIKRTNHLCFFSRNGQARKNLLNKIIDMDGKGVNFNQNKYGFDKFSMHLYIKSINEVLFEHNSHLMESTIEGALITYNSLDLFEKWLRKKFLKDMSYSANNRHPSRMILAFTQQIVRGQKTHTDIFNQIIGLERTDCILSDSDILSLKKIARQHIKNCKKDLYNQVTSRNELLNILRVVFEGKSDTLLSRHNDKYSTIDVSFRDIVKKVRTHYFSTLSPIMGKTGGWVTEFLDFAIGEIESQSHSNQDFKRKFSFIFPELSDILNKVSSSIA